VTIAPAYAGIFVWGPFFDQLWARDLPRASLGWLFASAIGSSLVCFAFLYYGPALLGFRSGRTLPVVAASAFGTVGSEWLAGVGVGLASIIWYAIAIDFAVDSTLMGLLACGLISRSSLSNWSAGAIELRAPVFLCTALFWIYITGTASLLRLTGVIVALMRVYTPIALLLLTAVAAWFLPGLFGHTFTSQLVAANGSAAAASGRSGYSAVQLACGYFAMAGLLGVDWGAVARRKSDLVLGGVTGVVLAGSWTACMSLIILVGAASKLAAENVQYAPAPGGFVPLSFRWAVFHGTGGIAAGVILILFGLAALAPACYSCWVYGQRLSTHWPGLRQSAWTWIGGLAAFVIVAASWASHLGSLFSAMGDVFAPLIGAMLGAAARRRGRRLALRPGTNLAGVLSWAAGCGASFALEGALSLKPAIAAYAEPTALFGFLVAAISYPLLASVGLERPAAEFPIEVDRAGTEPPWHVTS
jgi:hypothetical protein